EGHGGGAVLPRAGLGPAGAFDRTRRGPASCRQPRSLPGDGARRGGPARIGRLLRPQALAGPGGEWLPPALVGLEPRPLAEPLPRSRPSWGPLGARPALHGRRAGSPARAGGPHVR